MKQNKLENLFPPYLSSREDYLEAADLIDCHEKIPPKDEWVPAFVRLYYRQKTTSGEDIKNILKKKSISLIEGAHLLIGMNLNNISAVVMSKPVLHIYNMAIEYIRNHKLKTEYIDTEGFWGNHALNDEIFFHSGDQNISVYIEGTRHGIAHYFKPHIFIDWALSIGLLIDEKLLQFLGVLPRAICEEYIKQEVDYLPTNYILYAKTNLLTKNEIKDLSILSVAQVLWYTIPDIEITKMSENPLIKSYIPREGYENKDVFRNKVKIIDPRLKKGRQKKSSKNFKKPPDTPIIIPGVILKKEDSQFTWDHSKLKVVCATLLKTLLQINSSLDEEQLLNHDLIQLYITNIHPIVKEMVKEWISEAKRETGNKINIIPQFHNK